MATNGHEEGNIDEYTQLVEPHLNEDEYTFHCPVPDCYYKSNNFDATRHHYRSVNNYIHGQFRRTNRFNEFKVATDAFKETLAKRWNVPADDSDVDATVIPSQHRRSNPDPFHHKNVPKIKTAGTSECPWCHTFFANDFELTANEEDTIIHHINTACKDKTKAEEEALRKLSTAWSSEEPEEEEADP